MVAKKRKLAGIVLNQPLGIAPTLLLQYDGIPEEGKSILNGNVLQLYVKNDKSISKTLKALPAIPNVDQVKLKSRAGYLVWKYKRDYYNQLNNRKEEFISWCEEEFVIPLKVNSAPTLPPPLPPPPTPPPTNSSPEPDQQIPPINTRLMKKCENCKMLKRKLRETIQKSASYKKQQHCKNKTMKMELKSVRALQEKIKRREVALEKLKDERKKDIVPLQQELKKYEKREKRLRRKVKKQKMKVKEAKTELKKEYNEKLSMMESKYEAKIQELTEEIDQLKEEKTMTKKERTQLLKTEQWG